MEDFFENELIRKFERMIEAHEEYYFDSEEIEDIIIYYLELGDISYAEKATNYGLKIHPESIIIKTKQLEVFLELENYTHAKELIVELETSSSENTDYLVCCAKYYSNLGNSKKAISYCKKALELEEELNFLHNFIGDEYTNIGEPFRALIHYRKALEEDPTDSYALENCIVCFHEQKKTEEALYFLNSFLDQFPFSETAWYELGQLYFNRKNYSEAIKAFDYLLAINPKAVGVYTNKAACYEATKEYLNAIEVYKESLDVEYTKAYTYHRIGLCYKELSMPAMAISFFQKALVEDPQYYPSMMEQSYMYERLKLMDKALYFAQEATSFNENNPDYQKRLAFLYIHAGDFRNSVYCLKKLVEIEPERFYNWYAYTEILMIVEDYQGALDTLKLATKNHERAELYYQLSNCYFHLNKHDEAQVALEQALSMNQDLANEMQMKYPFIQEKVKNKGK